MSKEMQASIEMMRGMSSNMPDAFSSEYELARKGVDAMLSATAKPDVTITNETIGGVYTELLTPSKMKSDNIVYYIHGGAFTMGSAISSRGYGTTLAAWLGMRVYTVSYRLAPEHPYPAAVDDSYAVYKVLCERHKNNKIFLTGESAGGTLCLVLTQKAISDNIRVPDSIVSNCPAADLVDIMENINPKDMLVNEKLASASNKAYIDDMDPSQPGISPYYGDFNGFPSLILTCDADETFRRDCELVYNQCRESDIDVQLFVFTNTYHAFASTTLENAPESRMLLDITKAAFS